MDDADLEKLTIKPGKLKPKFQRNVTEYELLLNSGVSELNVGPLTRDSNASWVIVGVGTERKIKVTEGSSFVLTIEVSAEDGSTKQYNIAVTSLSASSAFISTLEIGTFPLMPCFTNNVLKYECAVPFDCNSVEVSATSHDKNTKIDIPDSENKQIKLNYGATIANVIVTSPDGSASITYCVFIQRKKFLFPTRITESTKCSICLAIPHCPVSVVDDHLKHIFCNSCLHTVTRTNKKHPITNAALGASFCVEEYDIDKLLSEKIVNCQFDCGKDVPLSQYANHLKSECGQRMTSNEKSSLIVFGKNVQNAGYDETECCSSCSRVLVKSEKSFHEKFICSSKIKFDFKHKLEVRIWQKKYQQECCDVDIGDAMNMAAVEIKQYKQYIKEGQNKGHPNEIISHLEKACQLYANVISSNDKNSEAHFKLGVILEEKSYAEDLYGIVAKQSRLKNEDLDDGEFQTDESMDDDIRALAEMRGFGPNTSVTNQLKALDQEYHALLEQGQSEKADYVQKLYAFKQKQHHNSGGVQMNLDADSYLNKALLKYLDAASVNPNCSLYHLHAGRIYLIQDKYKDALERFRCALSVKPTNTEAKFYLALCMICCGSYNQFNEIVLKYLEQGFNFHLFKEITKEANKGDHSCFAESFNEIHNTLLLDGIFQLHKRNPTFFSKQDVLEYLSTYCFSTMSLIHHRGKIFNKCQLIALESQYEWGMLSAKDESINKDNKIEFWRRLTSVTKTFCSTSSLDILIVQRKICEACINLLPRSSEALTNLGEVLYSITDLYSSDVEAKDIESLFRASIEVENTNMYEEDIPKALIGSSFWEKITGSNKPSQSSTKVTDSLKSTTSTQKAQAGSPAKKLVTTTTRSTPGNSKPAATVAANRGMNKKVSPQKSTGYSPMKASGVSKPLPGSSRSKTDAGKSNSKDKLSTADRKKHSLIDTVKVNQKDSKLVKNSNQVEKESQIELNKIHFESRLGLARILNSTGNEMDISEAELLYQEIIGMAPQIHDAYIELGEMLAKTKPLEAVAVYVKFPFSGDASYDDGYLYGEIVRILMKEEKYDDPELKRFMIRLGKVLGFSSLEKYITILDNKLKYNKLLREIFAGVNNKNVDDDDLKAFFKFKCWE